MYRCIPPEGIRVPITVMPAAVDDEVPEEAEIEQLVRSLKGGILGGPFRMLTKDKKGWLGEASRERNMVSIRWWLLVRLIQRTFKDEVVPKEVAWATMVLLLNRRGGYWGIGLVGVVWKVCAVVANCWLNRNVTLHDALHGFRAGRGMGTSTLEAKLVQKLEGLVHNPLF